MIALLNPYCTLAEVQAECQNVDPDDADTLRTAINTASRWIDWHCRRDFLFHDHAASPVEVLPSWVAGDSIYLPWPVLTLTAISIGGRMGDAVTLEAGTYFVEPNTLSATGKIVRAGRWRGDDAFSIGPAPRRMSNFPSRILLTGTFGYTPATAGSPAVAVTNAPSPALPADVQRACVVLAAVFSGKSRKDIIGPGGDRQSLVQKNIPKDASDVLARYRVAVL
jgi:hypothetical protein